MYKSRIVLICLVKLFCLMTAFSFAGCRPAKPAEDPSVWQKVHIHFKNIDENGLSGPSDGKVAVNYEFCLPQVEKYWKAVRRIDPSAQKQPAGKGRIGCTSQQWLIIGSTHQPRYQRVLYELASLPYVTRIEETFWE